MATFDQLKAAWSADDQALRDAIDDLDGAIPSSVEVDPDLPEDQRAAAFKLADQLNILKDFLDKAQKIEVGFLTDTVYTLAGNGLDEDWPEDADTNEDYQQSGPVILLLLEDLKVIEETLDQLFLDLEEDEEIDLEPYFLVGKTPDDDILNIITTFKGSAATYLENFPELSFSLKKEVPPIDKISAELGPTTIFCDPNLEASLIQKDPGWPFSNTDTHYIGMLAGEEGIFSSRFLPVRLQPQLSNSLTDFIRYGADNVSQGWNDPNYSILDTDGKQVSPSQVDRGLWASDGIEVPLGFEITVTEIVPSKTGIWVGFISSDPRASDLDNAIFGGGELVFAAEQTKVLYTKVEYIRIKKAALTDYGPDPYISERATRGDIAAAAVKGIKGAETIEPATNQNWLKLEPNDVKLQYYNFYLHNTKTLGQREIEGVSDGEDVLIYNKESMFEREAGTFQSLRYSEGYFYFIVGEAPRKTEAELINESDEDLEISSEKLEAAKSASGEASYEEIREAAWKKLLKYLGRSDENLSVNYIDNLKNDYFVIAAKKVNTQSVNPNNEKILFAIRADYVDSLPTNPRPYKSDFKAGSPFLKGNNYAFAINMGDIKEITADLVFTLKSLKKKVEDSKTTIENANELIFDFQAQIDVMEELPDILNEFFNRQSFPSSTNKSFIYDMVREGVDTTDKEHIVQIGVKDNGELGGNVRETVSYILFSPNPEKLKDSANSDSNLFYFDPYLTGDEISGKEKLKRSAIPLRIGLSWLREKLEGVYGSRALHLLLSHEKARKAFGAEDLQNNWMEFMSQLIVPPVKIYLSKRLSLDPEELECDEIIKKLNKAGPNLSLEDRLLQEKLYNSPICAEAYYKQFARSTPAVSPGMSKKELEKKAKKTEKGGNILDNQYVKILYTGFFNSLDTESIMALIMACLQKKLGLALTAEAICETAIIKLIESTGASSVEKVMLANALLNPDSGASKSFLEVYNGAPPFAPKGEVEKAHAETGQKLEPTQLSAFHGSPAAIIPFTGFGGSGDGGGGGGGFIVPEVGKSVVVIGTIAPSLEKNEDALFELDQSYNDAPIATSMLMSGVTRPVTEAVKSLEKEGTSVNLIPGNSTKTEIENERTRLKTLGYTHAETNAIMVGSGYLVPDPQQYEMKLGDGTAGPSPPGGLASLGGSGGAPYSYSATEDARVVEQNAENWLNFMKRTVGLASTCELIVGDILDGLQNLLRDPGAFFSGGGAGWWDSFIEGLKRQFSPPSPTLNFPDSLSTDNHMGDYGEKLLKTILSMVAQMLGQIVNLLLTSALEQCIEEDSDLGPSGRPPKSPPDIPFPTLERANLPKIGGLPTPDVVAWMKDILDNLSTGQLCALLRGDATKQTLQACLSRTKLYWAHVYNSGVDTIYEIRVAFETMGADINLDICNVVESPTLVNNLCEAVYDHDARCEVLKQGGLTQEECQAQIDQELSDLKNRVAGLTSLSLLDISPLSNSFPPICGDAGSFVIPPGVKDTMERITDNMLTNVKGSLMVDLAGLKFFSTPPRALLAATDPEELKKAHKMFIDAAKNPNIKQCLAVVNDPKNHAMAVGLEEADATGHGALPYEVYPLTYNRTVHCGNLSTHKFSEDVLEQVSVHAGLSAVADGYWVNVKNYIDLTGDGILDMSVTMEEGEALITSGVDLVALGYVFVDQTEIDKDSLRNALYNPTTGVLREQFNVTDAEMSKRIKLDLAENAPGPESPENILGSEEIIPLHAGLLINVKEGYNPSELISKALKGTSGQKVKAYVERLSPALEETVDFDTINNSIRAEYKKELKSPVIDYLTITAEQSLAGPIYTRKEDKSDDVINARGNSIPGNVYANFPGNADSFLAGTTMSPGVLRKVWPLDTKLKDIDGRPWVWYYMIRAYTGCDLNVSGDSELPGERNFSDQFKEDAFSSDILDPEDIDDFIDAYLQGATQNFDTLEEAAWGISAWSNNAKLHGKGWWYWFLASPGLRKLVSIMHERWKSGKNITFNHVLDDKSNDFNLGSAFMELTLAEATGLEHSRIKKIFPNMQNYFSSPGAGVMFGIANNPVVNVLDKDFTKKVHAEDIINENDGIPDGHGANTKDDKRWGTYEFYYPHFFVFEQVLPDPESPLSADPQTMIDHFSMDGEKVNKELYDALNFVPDSMLHRRGPTKEFAKMLINDFENLDEIPNYNPNILRYDLPFTEMISNSADAQNKAKEIMNIFSTNGNAGDQLIALADTLESVNLGRSLIHQNVSTPLSTNKESQLNDVMNVSKLIKASVTPFGETEITYAPSSPYIKSVEEYETYVNDTNEIITIKVFMRVDPSDEFWIANLTNPIYGGGLGGGTDFVQTGVEAHQVSWSTERSRLYEKKVLLYPGEFYDLQVHEFLMRAATDLELEQTNYYDSDAADETKLTLMTTATNENGKHVFALVPVPTTIPGDKTPIPPNIVVDDSRLSNEIYNFNFGTKLDPAVRNLIESIYSGQEGTPPSRFEQDYNELYKDTTLDPLNFKAQIFGQLLTVKLDQKIQEYLPANSSFDNEDLLDIKKFLTIKGFSGLQYAYSTQMFAKLKTSRLQNRGFMKKVWKRILKSPLTSDTVDPRCQEVFDQINAPSVQDLDKTETDFFNLEEVKPKIIEFYEKSLCQDIYESNQEGQDSTRTSLLEGMVSLVIKVYTLEMCLASVIAWDSFDLADAFKDSALVAVIIKNISEDFDIDFLSFFATDMLRKQENLTDIQLAKLLLGPDGAPQSSIKYLINREAENISSIVKNMFVNSFPLSTNLQVSLIKNSDPDFVEEFARQVNGNSEWYPAYKYASLATSSADEVFEYVTDVRIKDNIYTMNYGAAEKESYVDAFTSDWHETMRDFRKTKIDLFGLDTRPNHEPRKFKSNKNYFHSLPMNFYHALPTTGDDPYTPWKEGAWNVHEDNQKYAPFNVYNTAQRRLGYADAFAFENNPEATHGNYLNAKLGNITFEPYVRIVDWEDNDPERNFTVQVYSATSDGEPCEGSTVIDTHNINDFIDDIDEHIDKFRTAVNNVFNCEMRDYVPLSAWSYFYNHYFMKAVTERPALNALYDKFGLKPFFKKISFGMRMSYSSALVGGDLDALGSAFNSTEVNTPLKKVKSILGKRPYNLPKIEEAAADVPAWQKLLGIGGTTTTYEINSRVLHELQIPIVEIEKEIKSVEGTQSFTVGESDLFPLSALGAPDPTAEGPGLITSLLFHGDSALMAYATMGNTYSSLLKHLINNPHQFYYKNLADGLLQEVKNSPEFKLIYDYLFPMRRYMALATIMASDGLSKFIPEPTDVLEKTKSSLQIIIDNISNSTDYKHVPDPIANLLADRAMRSDAGTGAREPDMSKEILKIVLRTPLLILKGFVEITDPAIIIASRIIAIANAIQAATLAAIKQGVATAKRIMQAGIDAAKQILQQLEMQIKMGIGFAKSTVAMLPTIATEEGPVKLSDYVIMDAEADNVRDWVLKINTPPFGDEPIPDEWTKFENTFNDLKDMRDEYLETVKKLEELERKKRKLEEDSRVKIRKAENTMKDIFMSPYLLPGMWAAMLPSWIPLGGGMPPVNPWFVTGFGPPSTIPGMIYLALLFIDAIDEKTHDDMQKIDDPNCEDQL